MTLQQAATVPLVGLTASGLLEQAAAEGVKTLLALAAQGVLSTAIEYTYPLEEAAEAHRRQAAGGLTGRVVLLPRSHRRKTPAQLATTSVGAGGSKAMTHLAMIDNISKRITDESTPTW